MARKDEEEKKPRTFTTMPANAMADTRLSALQLRVLMAIAIHDGRSLALGKGAGCFARSSLMAAMVRTDITNFSKAVNVLMKLGYVVQERQLKDRRRFTLRVVEPVDDSWRDDQLSPAQELGESTNDQREMVGEPAKFPAEIVGDDDHENGSISKEAAAQKTSQREEIDFDESNELNSPKGRISPEGEKRHDDFSDQISEIFGLEKNGAEAPAIRVSISRELGVTGRAFTCKSADAQLSIFERAFDRIGRDASRLHPEERRLWGNWLLETSGAFYGEAAGHRADRILDEWEAAA